MKDTKKFRECALDLMECSDIGETIIYRLRSRIYFNKIVKRHMKQALKTVPPEVSAETV